MASLLDTPLLILWFGVSAGFITWIVNAWIHTRGRRR
jgi:hypothetical protein